MDWLEFWPLTALLAFCAIYASLWLAVLTCRVPEMSAGKLATASLLLMLVLGAFDLYAWGQIANAGDGAIVVIPLALAANFLIMLLVAPWLLRPPREYGSASAWGAAALGGLFFCILLVAVPAGVSHLSSKMRLSKIRSDNEQLLAGYNLPVPAGANFGVADSSIRNLLLKSPPYMGPPGAKKPPPAWYSQYSATHASMFSMQEPPDALSSFIESGLAQAGYEVYRLPHQMLGGSKEGVFVLYQVFPDLTSPEYKEMQKYGSSLNYANCIVKIYEQHAEEMTALCREAAAGG